ncbi:MAG: DUF1592 domain-containing protein [Pirellulales bacterium]
MSYLKWFACSLLAVGAAASARAEDAFQQQVMPFVATYCVECHNSKTASAELDLTRYTSAAALSEHFRQWEHVLAFVRKEEMPPTEARQPTKAERAEFLRIIEQLMRDEAGKLAGDPGEVLPRRLSSAEYNYTIRDLTGVDIHPAESFPIDPASGEGFNNTGEALVMSPNLFKKYYAAAQHVADHAVLTPTGLRFAPYPVVTFADQVKFHEQAILRFYEAHDVAYGAYLTAAWAFRYRAKDRQSATLEDWALEHNLSPRYLRTMWDTLADNTTADPFYLGWIRREWNALPAPADATEPSVPGELAARIRDLAESIRQTSTLLCAKEAEAIIANAGNGPVEHIARRRKSAAERDRFDENAIVASRRFHVEFRNLAEKASITIHLRAGGFSEDGKDEYVILREMNFSPLSARDYRPDDAGNILPLRDVLLEHDPQQWEQLKPGVHPLGAAIDADSVVLSASRPLVISVPLAALPKRQSIGFFAKATLDVDHSRRKMVRFAMSDTAVEADDASGLLADPSSPLVEQLKESCAALCRTFPNRFVFVDETRGLSAGFHLIEGVFRDDAPLCHLVLTDEQNRELDRLWQELYFGTGMMEKMLRGFVFFERSERNFLKHQDFDPFKEEDPDLIRDETLERFEQVYHNRSGVPADEVQRAVHPIHLFFDEIRQGLRRRRATLALAQPIYLRQLLDFAERAYRRPLADSESDGLRQFYQQICDQLEFGVEQVVRAVLTSILVSPHFSFHIVVPPDGDGVRPLPDLALASRLSYFLWSSAPDAELLALAKAGTLHEESTLRQQTRRMLADDKVAGFALEFFGQWLRYRDFLTQESVDRRVFPAFNDELKQAMFEEPTRLATHLIQNNLPLTDLLYGDTTFVNQPLAAHYDWPFDLTKGDWQRVDGIQQHGRGGVLGMAVFLTTNAQPQRTSPVKRGFWVVHKILGEHIPAPPNEVPPLPAKETETDGQTIRQLLAMHTEAAMCARCHQRFDPVGLAMEGFDPIGKCRQADLAGRPVDNVVPLPDGQEARGIPQFLQHLQASRNEDFLRTLCHKFLGYALGRSLQLSDHALLDEMQSNLQRDGNRFATLFETVINSPQFRQQRCRDFTQAGFLRTAKE